MWIFQRHLEKCNNCNKHWNCAGENCGEKGLPKWPNFSTARSPSPAYSSPSDACLYSNFCPKLLWDIFQLKCNTPMPFICLMTLAILQHCENNSVVPIQGLVRPIPPLYLSTYLHSMVSMLGAMIRSKLVLRESVKIKVGMGVYRAGRSLRHLSSSSACTTSEAATVSQRKQKHRRQWATTGTTTPDLSGHLLRPGML